MKKLFLILIILSIFTISLAQGEEKTIVSTYHPANSLIFGLQAHQGLVGISKHSDKVPLFQEVFPEMSELPQVGSRHSGINIESVIALNPDLIVLPPSVNGKESAERFQELGLNPIILDLESLDNFYSSLYTLGEELNKPEKADEVISRCKEMLEIVENHITPEEKPTCYYASQRNFLNTTASELLQSIMIKKAGGENVAAHASGGNVTIAKEQILLWNPDHIFISYNSNESLETLLADPIYSQLKAVKNGNVHKFPSNLSPWDYPSIEVFPAILWMSTKLYPEDYENFDFMETLNDFYRKIYGKSFTEFGGVIGE